MQTITDIAALEDLYGSVVPAARSKVVQHVTPCYRDWIGAARFVVLSTVGPEGTDASPRGDVEPVVHISDDRTLLLPDWRGNNRLDSLRNIVTDGRVSLMFMVPGSKNVVRVNGTAVVTADPEVCGSFERRGKAPATVIVVTVQELYYQCAKAIMRSELWSGADLSSEVPTAGAFQREIDAGFDAETYDAGYPAYARERMW
ncbi:pyridoxamine 5'-phosphate oxidase family protein [Salipiger mucosus]|uniref:Pyridoxamine 5'-phosphate oxidase family protein n=1 Tax=Salipiger mucosus DSM 16094 TaxID=1123237 RepID=S9SG50_9RHOB|nr:pyridoxamine 5'-phosphate oxidase family protein [Salipiger mucosus]EPX85269.1 Pyridoxamine 5'-phosphate oxidase family protein [Salipiger mucosus DSM 16094]